jgi:ankyrin repeat protein
VEIVQVEDSYNGSALQLAAFKGRADLVAMIVTAGVDVNQGDSKVRIVFNSILHTVSQLHECNAV